MNKVMYNVCVTANQHKVEGLEKVQQKVWAGLNSLTKLALFTLRSLKETNLHEY